jgi:hypothetical protein
VPSTSLPAPGAAPSASDDPLFSPDPQVRAGAALAGVVRDWNESNPAKPVSVALVHEPYAVPPLLGTVPLVLTGHFHSRDVRLDESGTRVMREGSTGGGGISSTSLQRVTDEDPVPQTATLLYIARSGERAGQVLAYDQITVGGFGLASVSLDRTVVRPDEPVLAPGEVAPSEGGDGGDGGDTTPGSSAPAAVVTSATRRG